MSEPFLYPKELSRGPDLLRPGSSTGRYGSGQYAFIVTQYPNSRGEQLHKAGAATGHESMITNPEVLEGLFGPDLDKVMPEIASSTEEYEYKDGGYKPSGRMKHQFDHWEIRKRSMDTSLYGRYGTVRGRPVVMLWQHVPGWEDKLRVAAKELQIPDDAVLVVGTTEVGTLGETQGVKDDPQEKARLQMMAKYHTAIGAEKMALKSILGIGKGGGHPYPDTSKMTQDQIDKYPFTRDHWRQKARQHGIPGVFDYGEATLAGFKEWISPQLLDRRP